MMSFVEFLVFIVTMVLFVFMSQKQAQERRKYLEENPDIGGDDPDAQIREMMRALNISEEEAEALEADIMGRQKKTPPPSPAQKQMKKKVTKPKPKRTLSDQYTFDTRLDHYQQKTRIEDRHIETNIEHRYEGGVRPIVSEGLRVDPAMNPYAISHSELESKAAVLVRKGGSLKKMIVMREILDKPKALNNNNADW